MANLVVNGTFTGTSDPWLFGTQFSYDAGNHRMVSTPGSHFSDQFLEEANDFDFTVMLGGTYDCSITIGGTTGSIDVLWPDGFHTYAAGIGVVNVSVESVYNAFDYSVSMVATDSFDGTIDDVSVLEAAFPSGSAVDNISVSEHVSLLIISGGPLSQDSVGMVDGEVYLFSFDVDSTASLLKVYQGTQLVYDMATVSRTSSDRVYVTESIAIRRFGPVSVSSAVLITESITLNVV